jgi:thiol-disulfide isomerase/thioredoxin
MNSGVVGILLQTLVHMTAPQPASVPPQPVEGVRDRQHMVYLADRDARADVGSALAEARLSGKTVIVIMGASWCHDSVSLASQLQSPRFTDMMQDRFSVVYVDVGTPQIGKGRNLDIAKRFGISKVKSTPLVMLVSGDGKLLNSKKDAIGWRNAASRNEDDVFGYFATFTGIM